MELPGLDDVINQLADICKPVVQAIEKEPAKCKDRYDEYMAALDRLAKMLSKQERNRALYLSLGVAMQRAGGNKKGIEAALRVMGML